MALTDTHSASSHALIHVATAPFRAIGNFLISLMENNSRIQYAERLNAMSDAELKERGLERTQIVQHVFRDHMHI